MAAAVAVLGCGRAAAGPSRCGYECPGLTLRRAEESGGGQPMVPAPAAALGEVAAVSLPRP